jgi:hypothetical protein
MSSNYDKPKIVENADSVDLNEMKEASLSNKGLTDDLPLPSALAANDEATAPEVDIDVIPPQEDEFTCSECFLVKHISQLGETTKDMPICKECM